MMRVSFQALIFVQPEKLSITYLLAYKLAARKLPFSVLSWGVKQRMLVDVTI